MLIKPFYGIQIDTSNANYLQIPFTYSNPAIWLLKKKKPSFYICRTTLDNHICWGTIAQLSYDNSHKKVYKHESCFDGKLSDFGSTFENSNVQLSPTLLVHDNNTAIEEYIQLMMKSFPPDRIYNKGKDLYEIWVIPSNKRIIDIYNAIDYLFIADGHHRVSCLFSLNKDVCAYIVPKKCIRSYPIIRKYNSFKNSSSHFFERIKTLFPVKSLTCEEINSWKGDYFALSYKGSNFALHTSDFLRTLASFSTINYIEGRKPNFINYKYHSDHLKNIYHYTPNENFYLLIPSININDFFPHPNELLPVHSSWFEPKIPAGIFQMEII